MSDLFADVNNIGELYYYHTYLFYDEPQIFSCVTKTRHFYFITTIPSDNAESSWLAVPISTGKLCLLEKNAIEIRNAFLEPESLLFRIDCSDRKYSSSVFPLEYLSNDLLPESGELLDYCAGQELAPSSTPTAEQARREMRDIIEISLEKDDQHISELPCAALSEVLDNVQQLVSEIGIKRSGLSGTIPSKIKNSCTLYATSMFAASVGIRLKSSELSDLFDETPLTGVLADLDDLLNCMGDRLAMKEYISSHDPRVAVKLRAFLKSLVKHNVGLKINSASPNNNSYSRQFSTKQLNASLDLIDSDIKEIVDHKILSGKIVGINVENRTFAFKTTDNKIISGKLSDAIKDIVFEVPQAVMADVEIKTAIDSLTQEAKPVYSLLNIEPVTDEKAD